MKMSKSFVLAALLLISVSCHSEIYKKVDQLHIYNKTDNVNRTIYLTPFTGMTNVIFSLTKHKLVFR